MAPEGTPQPVCTTLRVAPQHHDAVKQCASVCGAVAVSFRAGPPHSEGDLKLLPIVYREAFKHQAAQTGTRASTYGRAEPIFFACVGLEALVGPSFPCAVLVCSCFPYGFPLVFKGAPTTFLLEGV